MSDALRTALKRVTVPRLRAAGFRGTLPDFRRAHAGGVDLVCFQFSQWGPSLYVEIARVGPQGVHYASGDQRPIDGIKVHHVPLGDRQRVGSPAEVANGFDFAAVESDPELADRLARRIADLLDHAQPFWNEGAGQSGAA